MLIELPTSCNTIDNMVITVGGKYHSLPIATLCYNLLSNFPSLVLPL